MVVLVKMLQTVGYCRKGLVYRVDRRIADQWIVLNQAKKTYSKDDGGTEVVSSAEPVDMHGEPSPKVPRKRRRRRRKH